MAAQIPRVELAEMGPQMDLAIRRTRPAAADLEREAMKRALTHKKKVRPPFPDSFPHNVWTLSNPEGTILVLCAGHTHQHSNNYRAKALSEDLYFASYTGSWSWVRSRSD